MPVSARARLQIAAAALLLAVAVALPGAAQAARVQDTPEAAATAICAQLQAAMGSQFARMFGSVATCEARAVEVVKSSIEACKTAADKEACLRKAIQDGVTALVSGGGGTSTSEIAEQVLEQTCARLKSELGAQFAKKYGSVAGCKDKLRSDATELVSSAMSKCKTAANKDTCISEAVADGIATLTDRFGGASADEVVEEIAEQACARLQSELGDKFAKKFGSLAGCKAQLKEKAAPVAKAAIAKCQKAADRDACITQAIETSTESLSESLGAGPGAEEVAKEIAEQVCERLEGELGDKFAKKFGSAAGCRRQILDNATDLAREAIAKCGKASDRNACMTAAIEAGTAKLSERLGAGPSAEDVGAEIAEQVCTRLKGELAPKDWERKYGTLALCKDKIGRRATKLAETAIATCRKAADRQRCVEQAIREGTQSLTDELGGGPGAREIAEEIAGQVCTRLGNELGAEKFRQKFGVYRSCREKIEQEAREPARKALAACKSAGDRESCIEKAVRATTATLTDKLGGGGPTAKELAAKIASQTCERLRDAMGADHFNERFGPNETLAACRAAVADKAARLAQEAMATCEKTDVPKRESCVADAIAAGAKRLEADLRSSTAPPSSARRAAIEAVAERACQEAKTRRGGVLDAVFGSLEACKTKLAKENELLSLVGSAFEKCKSNEACIRKEVEDQAEQRLAWLLRSAWPDRLTPAWLGGQIATRACFEALKGAIAKGRRADFDSRLGSIARCELKFRDIGVEIAKPAIAACDDVRPEDKKIDCYGRTIAPGGVRLGQEIDKALKKP